MVMVQWCRVFHHKCNKEQPWSFNSAHGAASPGCLLPGLFSHLSTRKIVWLSNHAKIHKTMGRY